MLAQILLFKSLDVDTVVSVMTSAQPGCARAFRDPGRGALAQDMYFVISGGRAANMRAAAQHSRGRLFRRKRGGARATL
jgi:hypothetical protein